LYSESREVTMTTVSYSKVRENLAAVWDEIEDSREEVILRRRGHEDLALLPAHELRSLKETAHLLRSPANAARLLGALARSRGEDGGLAFEKIEELAAAVGLQT
jgi:antitoxin YefM